MAWYCKPHKTKASVKMRLLASIVLALYGHIPARIIKRETMAGYATGMSLDTLQHRIFQLSLYITSCCSRFQFANRLETDHGPEGMCWFLKSACSRRIPASNKAKSGHSNGMATQGHTEQVERHVLHVCSSR